MPLPLPPSPAPPVNRSLDGLAPEFRARLLLLKEKMAAKNWPIRFEETSRTPDRQTFLHGFGRLYDDAKPRGVVTWATDPFGSWHAYDLACDVIHATLYWNAPAAFWRDLEVCAEAVGLRSGADWDMNDTTKEKKPDRPHVQFGHPMPAIPTATHRALLKSGGREAVWAAVGAIAPGR